MKALIKWVKLRRDYDFGDLLDRIFHLFTEEYQFIALVIPRAGIDPEDYPIWKQVVGKWKPNKLNEKLSDQQLQILVDAGVVSKSDVAAFRSQLTKARPRDESPKRN